MSGERVAADQRQQVVEEDAGAVVRPLPDAMAERDEEPDRPYQVRADRLREKTL